MQPSRQNSSQSAYKSQPLSKNPSSSALGLSHAQQMQPLLQFQPRSQAAFILDSKPQLQQQFQLQFQPSANMFGDVSPKSIQAGKAFFHNPPSTMPPTPKEYGVFGNFRSSVGNNNPIESLSDLHDGEEAQSINKQEPYSKNAMFDTLKQMDYAKIFQAQAPLDNVSKRFNLEVDKKQKASMIKDVLDYLDLDLTKMIAAREKQNKSMLVRGRRTNSPGAFVKKQSLYTGPRASTQMQMPNVYTMKDLPCQKAIISPRIQRNLGRSESLMAVKIKKYVFSSSKHKNIF